MKHGIVKFWVCQNCQKEYLDKPIMCSKCEGLQFELKYGGMVTDSEELTHLVESYKYADLDRDKDIRLVKNIGKSKDAGSDKTASTDKEKRSRM